MKLKSIAIRAGLATAGILCGGILGGCVASIIIFALPLEGVFRTNGIVVGTAIGAGIGYGAYRAFLQRKP